MSLSVQGVITAAALLGAVSAIAGWIGRVWGRYEKLMRYDEDLRAIKEEQQILTLGVLACLKGLKEQGCNGPVSDAVKRLEDFINRRAHE